MSRRQFVLVILINALISALITAAALRFVVQPALEQRVAQAPTLAAGATAVQTAAGTLPSPTPIVHVVVQGDTISGLALKYDVPAADIIAANALANPNFLQLGAELIIPVGGVPNATATPTPVPTATDTPIPFEPPSADMTATAAAAAGTPPLRTPLPTAGDLRIEITEVIKPGELEQEAAVLTNIGSRLADMQGWTLRDADGNTYTFPNFRLWSGGNVTVHTGGGLDGSPPSHFYWGRAEAVWAPGEIVTLQDAAGLVIATYLVER